MSVRLLRPCPTFRDLRDVLEIERLHDDIQLVNRQNPVYVDSAEQGDVETR
jgi:hypothetical protein